MAGVGATTTTTVSPWISLRRTELLRSLSPSPSLSIPSSEVFHRQCCIATSRKSSKISICRGKLNDSVGEEAREIDEAFFDGEDLEDESDEDEAESSVDLLIRFLQSMFKKVSKRAKKASRAVLPAPISPQLVSFAVDGILLLASLSIVKALLEVVCTLGGTVFVVIMLVRLIWVTISYFQSSGNNFNQAGSSFGTTQPVA